MNLDINSLRKGQLITVAECVDASSRADFEVLKTQNKIHRQLRFTTKRVGRDSLAILPDGEAFRHNFAEHEKARRAMALRRILMESIDISMLSDAEREEYSDFLATQVRDVEAIRRQRMKETIQRKRDRGEWVGGMAPYGFTVNDTRDGLSENPQEQEVIAAAVGLWKGGAALVEIVRSLFSSGYRNRRGSMFAACAVKAMIARAGCGDLGTGERSSLNARVRAAVDRERSEVVPFGGLNEAEMATLGRILDLSRDGVPKSRIACLVNAEGLRMRCGSLWYPDAIRDVLARQGVGQRTRAQARRSAALRRANGGGLVGQEEAGASFRAHA